MNETSDKRNRLIVARQFDVRAAALQNSRQPRTRLHELRIDRRSRLDEMDSLERGFSKTSKPFVIEMPPVFFIEFADLLPR